MTEEELRARLAEIVAEMRTLAAIDIETITDDQATQFDALETESVEVRAKVEKMVKRHEAIRKATEGLPTAIEPSIDPGFNINVRQDKDAWDMSTLRFDASANDIVSRARTAIESDKDSDDWARQAATKTMERNRARAAIAKHYLATGSPTYRSGFVKALAGQGHAITPEESAAITRAQSLTDADGGYTVPFTLDPTVLLTNDGASNPIRAIARVEQIMTDSWNGVTSVGATASYDPEATQVSDDSITLDQPTVPVHKMQIFVPYSIEIGMDWANIQGDLRNAMFDASDRLDANKFVKGTGTNEPIGIETALTGTASVVSPATAEVFAQADVFNTKRQLGRRYRQTRDQAKWVAADGTYDDIRQFDTGGGGGFWTDMNDGTPDRLLSYQTWEGSEVDDTQDLNAAATETNFVLFFGDWMRYLIADRIGMQLELIPHLFATANNRPIGQRALYGWKRTGADSIDDNAFRVLSIPTTA